MFTFTRYFQRLATFVLGWWWVIAGEIVEDVPIWSTSKGRVHRDDEVYHIRGMNWNGMESSCHVPYLLWTHHEDVLWDLLQQYGVNSLRLPLSYSAMKDPWGLVVKPSCVSANQHLMNATVHDILMRWLDRASERHMTVLFELHTINNEITAFPWTDNVSFADTVAVWNSFGRVYGSHPAVIGWGLKNEPHGACSLTDFFKWCTAVIDTIDVHVQRTLYFISGVQISMQTWERQTTPWGGTFYDLNDTAFHNKPWKNRIVFEPHVYGPAVIPDAAPDWDLWMSRFGFIRKREWAWTHTPLVFTEMGGTLDGDDGTYFDAFLLFAHAHNMTDMYWWTLGVSHDTGTMMDGDTGRKVEYIQRFQPLPTFG
jgi:aryl-phospho-beta-D-glucosidase BglC (GH1 family)